MSQRVCLDLRFLYVMLISIFFFFFFQAEDGIRDLIVTGVQTCALPISFFHYSGKMKKRGKRTRRGNVTVGLRWLGRTIASQHGFDRAYDHPSWGSRLEIGRASCRERV